MERLEGSLVGQNLLEMRVDTSEAKRSGLVDSLGVEHEIVMTHLVTVSTAHGHGSAALVLVRARAHKQVARPNLEVH